MAEDTDEEILKKLQELVERMEAEQAAAIERVKQAAARLPTLHERRAAASRKMRGYHQARVEDPSLPRTRTSAPGEDDRQGGDDDAA